MRFSHGMPTHRFTADQVMKMVDAGVLDEDTPVELIDGELIVMSPPSPQHNYATRQLRLLFGKHYGHGTVFQEHTIQVDDYSLPEPDIAIVPGDQRKYQDAHPTGRDCLLVLEVSKTSQSYDRRKADLYAAGGVPEYWLVDITEQTVSVYQKPTDGGYALVTVARRGETLALPGLDASVKVADLLP